MRYCLLLLFASVLIAQCDLRFDADGDGRPERIRVRGDGTEGPLVAEDPRGRIRWTIDPHVVTRECHPLEIFGRRGLVIFPHGMALRFYEFRDAQWTYRDLYTFYTASWQGGLVQADINGDGRPDLFAGNYWLESPAEWGLHWRLYAINTFSEHPDSATAQLHWDGERLLWVESRRPRGRIIWFRPPADRRQLWTPAPHPLNEKLDCPQLTLRQGRPQITSAGSRRCR